MFRQRAACFRHPRHLPLKLGPCLKIKITKRTHFGFPISYCTSAAYADLRPFESKKRTHFANGFWNLDLGIWHPESCLSRGDSGLIGPYRALSGLSNMGGQTKIFQRKAGGPQDKHLVFPPETAIFPKRRTSHKAVFQCLQLFMDSLVSARSSTNELLQIAPSISLAQRSEW